MTSLFDAMACCADTIRAAKQFVPVKPEVMSSMNPVNADFMKLMQAQNFFTDNDTLFDRFLEDTELEEFAYGLDIAIKEKHTIVAKWPMRLGSSPTQREFDLANQSGHQGSERYVEWRRT